MSGEPFEEPVGLADRVDDLLVRVEGWSARARPLMVGLAVAGLVVTVGWWSYAAAVAGPPVEDRIPLAGAAGEVTGAGPFGEGPTTGPGAAGTTLGDGAGGAAGPDPAAGTSAQTGTPAELVVHVVGAVRRPGLVILAGGDRISDAVQAAGGALPDADVDRLNLASPLVDGMQIRVPTTAGPDDPPDRVGGTGRGDEPLVRLPAGASPGGEPSPSTPVDLNRATMAELESLPGIGPALASAIVDWRTEHGPFATVDDLEAVSGIGPAKLAALRDRLAV